ATNSTFTDNSAGGNGGAIANFGMLTLANSTVALNRADTDVIGNAVGHGGGLYLAEPTTTLRDTLIAGNTSNASSDDISTANADIVVDPASSYNLVANVTTAGGLLDGSNGNIVGNHGFGNLDVSTILDETLRNNGGPTRTLALILGSPAI